MVEAFVIGLVLGVGGAAGIFYIYKKKQEEKVLELIDYVRRLARGEYDLKSAENSENRLSLLSNELYKMAVVLNEKVKNNRRARRELQVALEDISHQLRTPLTSVKVAMESIEDDPEMPDEVRQEFLNDARRQLDLMTELLNALLKSAKFESGAIELKSREVTIGEILKNVKRNLEVLCDLDGVEIVMSGDLRAKVKIDKKWQTEALTNVVKNAAEHSPQGEKVLVKVRDNPLFVEISVRDFGAGIAAKDLKHVFERFYKIKNARAESIGIGLSFAKTVIERENGQITAKSEPGAGTTFAVKYFKV